MRKIHTESVQNRFTAYLQMAIINKRIQYINKKIRQRKKEQVQIDLLEKGYTDFDTQLIAYRKEKEASVAAHWEQFPQLLEFVDNKRLIKEINRLKERERQILFAKIFGELPYRELGEVFDLEPKQAEMAYFYIIRKIRKRLEEWRDEL